MATIFAESFETDGNGSRYVTSIPEFTDGGGDFFLRTDGSDIGTFYEVAGQDGSFFFAGMDLDGEGDAAVQTLTISSIDITGFENLSLSLLVAEDDDGANQDWDADSQLLIEVSVDGGAFQSLIDFQATGDTNTEPALDTDGDGLGDGTALSATFATFSSAIAGTGSSLDVRISFNNLDAGDEDAAIDNIVIEGDAVGTTPDFNLQITEIWPGNDQNPDLTEDWFEVTNTGTEAWVAATEGDLYFDDVSASTADADLLSGIGQIDPGETVIFIDDTDTVTFESVWAPVIDLTNVQIGTYSGAGLGGGGDAVTLFLDPNCDGDLSDAVTLDSEAYPDTTGNPGASFDVPNAAFSVDGVNGAVATAPNSAGESAIGSPGNGAAIVPQVADFTLELLHFADQEANAATIDNIDNLSGVLNALRNEDLGGDGVADNTLTLSSGDAIIPGLFFDASEAVFGSAGIADIQIQNELGVQAIALGNHEFDLGTGLLAGLIDGSAAGDFSALTSGTAIDGQDFAGADFAYLSTNLDFSTDPNLAPLAVAGGGAPQANTVTSSVVIDVNGENIGVVGATVPTIRSISSPGEDLGVSPAWASGTPTDAELDALAAIIQAEVDALLTADPGLNKIILASHMQQISIELALAERLTDVDIIIAGGSNTRLFDDNDRIRDGDSDQGQYPQFVTNAGGTSTAVVNTDGTYKYVGRLVIDFDADGNLIEGSYDETVSGAYATDDQGVADLNAEGLIDPEIDAITDAIQAQIVATESNVFGVSDVFLNGNRSGTFTPDDPDGVRTQETNLGNLTADANLDYANQIVSDQLVLGNDLGGDVLISIKNGGGIRANIGEIVVPPGGDEAVRLPNSAVLDETGTVVKPEGGISQNDIATTLAFNNGLVLLDMTKAELKDFLEGAVAALPTGVSGGFPQISGLKFSFDETQTAQTYNTDGSIAVAGERIVNAGIFDENDTLIAEIVRDGEVVGDSTESFRVVTLDFLANAGDEILSTLSNPNRVDLQDLDGNGADDGIVTGAATFADDGSEQDALAEYLNDNFNPDNGGTAFNEVDTGPALDERIQNLTYRTDTVLQEVVDVSLVISEIMYNPDSAEDDWEWIEITNTGTEVVDLSGFVLDDANASFHAEATIVSGSIAAGESAVLYNADDLTTEQFSAAWGEGLNLVAVTDWGANAFNNSGDTVALWSSFADYSTDISTGSIFFDNTVDFVIYDDSAPFPVDNNDASIYLTDLTADNNDGSNWALSEIGVATPSGTGRESVADATSGNDGDVGSPGGDPEVVLPPFEIPDPVLVEAVAGTITLAGAEIVDFDATTQRAFVTSGDGLQVIDASDLSSLSVIATLSAGDLGFDSSDITSVSVNNGVIAVARPDPTGFIDDPLGTPGTGGDEFTGAGQVLFYDAASLGFLGVVQVGALPDMLTWNDAGTHVLVANEGQSSGDENQPDALQNPNGSVSVIAFNATNPTASTVTTLDFTDSSITFEALETKGVRVASPNTVPDGSTNFAPSAAADLEPEYITIEGSTAYIALQENNAVAVIDDITAPTAFTIDDIIALGTKDHSLAENALDPSNEDGGINIDSYPVQGLFQPDGMASYTVDGQQYFFTANEGDGRDVDESRGADLVDGDLTNGEVDTTAFDAQTLADLADDAVLGRLKFSNIDGDTDGDGLIEELTSFGARSFSIFDAAGNLVFDSGSDFERITEILTPEEFNGNGLASSFDSRSDDKGPEPESVVLGEIDGRTYAFVGLERVGGIVVYDVTDPENSEFAQYIRNEDANGDLVDIAPEGLRFITSAESPTGNALLAVTSEESNTLTFHELTPLDNTVRIHQIQGVTEVDGTGSFTSGVDDVSVFDGQTVVIEAVVTADFQGSAGLAGFYVQEEDADADALDTTSEGIFIFDGDTPLVDVNVGDIVRVTGTVTEFFGETQISASLVEVRSSGNELPTATVVEFPSVGLMTTEDGDLVAGLEQYEGMLITIPTEMTVTELFNLDRFGQIKVSSDGRLEQFTQNNAPDAAGFAAHLEDLAVRTLTIDDGQDVQNPDPILIPDGNDGTLTATDSFRMGDTLTNITGVVTYSEDFQSSSEEPEFRIHLPPADYSADNPRPATPEDVTLGLTETGVLKVASLNVLNYFTTIDDGNSTTDTGQSPRGADDLTRFGGTGLAGTDPNAEFDRQKAKLVEAIVEMDADILGLVELENSATDAAVSDLVAAVNTALGSAVYDYIPTGVIGGDAIAQGLIYKTDSVTPTGDFETLETFNGIDFTDPLSAGLPLNRPALAQTFTENTNGETVTIAVNHLKSKGSLSGLAADNDQGDGQGNNNATRAAAADLLQQWLASDPTGQGSDNVLIIGDLNAYAQEDPITTLESAGFTDLATEFAEDGEQVYSFVFDGQIGTLDYALANDDALSRVTDVTEWHINADEADAIDYNLDFGRDETIFDGSDPARHSDHDPIIFGLDFRSVVSAAAGGGITRGTNAGEVIEGTDVSDFILGGDGEDRMIGGGGDDRYVVNSVGDVVFELSDEGHDTIGTSVSLFGPDNVEDIVGIGSDDITIVGNDQDNWFIGTSGNNLLTGEVGRDRLDGAAGNDILIGGVENDVLEGGSGADIFVVTEDNGIDTILDFEDGVDLIDLTGVGLTFQDLLITGTTRSLVNFVGGTIVINELNVVDLSAADFIEAIGAPSVPVVEGTENSESLFLLTGPVELRGLGGNDLLGVYNGSATLAGGEGDDRLYVYDEDTTIIENAGEGTDTVYTQVDITLAANVENGVTDTGDDIDITGNDLNNRINGRAGENTLTGHGGDDVINAGGGNDVIDGGAGRDALTGGTEADAFVFVLGDGLDIIRDFELDLDVIDFSGTALQFVDLTITDGGSGALVDYGTAAGTDVIEVSGVTAADLLADQFSFVPLS